MHKHDVSDPLSWLLSGVLGTTAAVVTASRYRTRVVDPDRPDPARHFRSFGVALLLTGLLAGAWASRSDQTMLPAGLIIVVASFLCCLGIATISIGAYVWRRKTGYAICRDSYQHAPRAVDISMRKIYKSAAQIKSGRAYKEGLLGDIQINRLVFSVARRAVLSSELSRVAADIGPTQKSAESRESKSSASRLQQLSVAIDEVEKSLDRAREDAKRLSTKLDEGLRAEEERQSRVVHQQRIEKATDEFDELQNALETLAPLNTHEVEDRISSAHYGYSEVQAVTDRVTGTSARQVPDHNADTSRIPTENRPTSD